METEKPVINDNNLPTADEKTNNLPLFAVICYILQITTIFNSHSSDNVIINLLFLFFIIIELCLFNYISKYLFIVFFKTIVFVIAYKYIGVTSNEIFIFPLIQISFLFYHFSKCYISPLFISIIHIITLLFIILFFYITYNYNNIQIIYYSIFLFIILCLIINYLKYFTYNTQFTIYTPKTTKLLVVFQNIKIPVFTMVLLSLFFLPFIDNNYVILKIIFVIFIIIPSIMELKDYITNKKKYNLKLEISWQFPVIYFIIVGIIYYISKLNMSNELYKVFLNFVFNIIIPLAIFNISALFILLQMNYNKFSSTYLIKQILKSPLLIISTFFPSLVIVANLIFKYENIELFFIPPTILLLCFTSSVFFIIYFKTVLETNVMLKKILITVTEDDFDNYKENVISFNETNIDAILKIVQAIIKNNDTPRVQSTFYSLIFWVNENIKYIKYESWLYRDQYNNKFNSFFNTINHELLSSNNIIMHNYYLCALRDLVIPLINSDNYKDYKILFISLHNYLIKRLKNKQEEYAKETYNIIYKQCSVIFLHLREDIQGQFNDDLFEFNELFLDRKLDKIINTAIENKCTEFLRYIHIFDDLFVLRHIENFNNYDHWDDKVKDLFMKIKFIIQQKNKYLLENYNFFSPISSDYEIFMKSKLDTNEKTEYKCYNSIIKYVFNELENIYCYAISINRRFNDFDFSILWKECFYAIGKKDEQVFNLFYSFLAYIFDKIFENELKKENPDYGMIYTLFSRIIQIKDLNNNTFIEITMKKYSKLIEKYPKLIEFEKLKPVFEFIENIDYLKRFEI